MAGDLLYLNTNSTDLAYLELDAGAVLIETVFHCDKGWSAKQGVLDARLANPDGPQNRTDLPAHCYLEFRRDNVDKLRSKVHSATLARVLGTVTRPKSIVKAQPTLVGWDTTEAKNRAGLIVNALNSVAAISLEFYTVGSFSVSTIYSRFDQAPE